MNKVLIIISLFIVLLPSCIDWGLDELPVYDEANILEFDLEYRYSDKNDNGHERLAVVSLNATADIDTISKIITVDVSIPAPSGSFSQDERRKVSLENVIAYVKLSPAAKIYPIENSPKLGKPGDFTKERKYKVVAADGKTEKVWTVKVNPLPVINQFEGTYLATGVFDHPTGGQRTFELEKYVSSVDNNTVITAHSDLGEHGYEIKIKVNSNNSVDVIQLLNGEIIGEMTPEQVNNYNPDTKTFTLHYRYEGSGGYRSISETFVLK